MRIKHVLMYLNKRCRGGIYRREHMITGENISEDEVIKGRSSYSAILEDLASDPGQWKQYKVKNASVATQIKRNRGYDARTFRMKDEQGNFTDTFILQACYKGPEFVANFIPKTRKTKSSGVAEEE